MTSPSTPATGARPARQTAVDIAAGSPVLDWQRGLPRKRMAAEVVLVDDDDRVLLVRPT